MKEAQGGGFPLVLIPIYAASEAQSATTAGRAAMYTVRGSKETFLRFT